MTKYRVVESEPDRHLPDNFQMRLEKLDINGEPTGDFVRQQMKRVNGKLEPVGKQQPERHAATQHLINAGQGAAASIAAVGTPQSALPLLALDAVRYGAETFAPDSSNFIGQLLGKGVNKMTGGLVSEDDFSGFVDDFGYSWDRFANAKKLADDLVPLGHLEDKDKLTQKSIGAAGAFGGIISPGLAGARLANLRRPKDDKTGWLSDILVNARPGVATPTAAGSFFGDEVEDFFFDTDSSQKTASERVKSAETHGYLGSLAMPSLALLFKLFGKGGKGAKHLKPKEIDEVNRALAHLKQDPAIAAAAEKLGIKIPPAFAAGVQGQKNLSQIAQTNKTDIGETIPKFDELRGQINRKGDEIVPRPSESPVSIAEKSDGSVIQLADDVWSAKAQTKKPFTQEFDELSETGKSYEVARGATHKKTFDELGEITGEMHNGKLYFGTQINRIRNALRKKKKRGGEINLKDLIEIRKSIMNEVAKEQRLNTQIRVDAKIAQGNEVSRKIDDIIEKESELRGDSFFDEWTDLKKRYKSEYSDLFQTSPAYTLDNIKKNITGKLSKGNEDGWVRTNIVKSGQVDEAGLTNLHALKNIATNAKISVTERDAMLKNAYDVVAKHITGTPPITSARGILSQIGKDGNQRAFVYFPEILENVIKRNDDIFVKALKSKGGLTDEAGKAVDEASDLLDWATTNPKNMELLRNSVYKAHKEGGVDLLRWQVKERITNNDKPHRYFTEKRDELRKIFDNDNQFEALNRMTLLLENARLFSKDLLLGSSTKVTSHVGLGGKFVDKMEDYGQTVGKISSSMRAFIRNIQGKGFIATSHFLDFYRHHNLQNIVKAMMDESVRPGRSGFEISKAFISANYEKVSKDSMKRIMHRFVLSQFSAFDNRPDSVLDERRALEVGRQPTNSFTGDDNLTEALNNLRR